MHLTPSPPRTPRAAEAAVASGLKINSTVDLSEQDFMFW